MDPEYQLQENFLKKVSSIEPNWRKFFPSTTVANKRLSDRFLEMQKKKLELMFSDMDNEDQEAIEKPATTKHVKAADTVVESAPKRRKLIQSSISWDNNKV